MTDLILYSKPFDWNDNLSEEAIEDFEGIQKDLPYCSCQNIGMALAKLELLEKQGCKVIDPSGSSSENPNKCDDAISRRAVMDEISDYNNDFDYTTNELYDRIKRMSSVTSQPKIGHCKDCKYFEYDSVAKVDGVPLIVAHEICSKWGNGCKTSEDGYCFLFEPQEGGDQE